MRATPLTPASAEHGERRVPQRLDERRCELGRKLARRARHPFSPDVLVRVSEDLRRRRRAQRPFDGRQLELRPGAGRHVQVEEIVAVRLDDGAGPQMGVGVEPSQRRVEVGDDLDTDRRAPETGLHDVRAREPEPAAPGPPPAHPRPCASSTLGSTGSPAAWATPANASLSIPKAAPATPGPV